MRKQKSTSSHVSILHSKSQVSSNTETTDASRQSSYLLLCINLLKLRSDEVLIASSSVQSAVHSKMNTHTAMSSPPSFEKAHQCKCGLLHLLRLQLQQPTPLLASVYNSTHDSAPPSHELRVAYEYLYLSAALQRCGCEYRGSCTSLQRAREMATCFTSQSSCKNDARIPRYSTSLHE